MFRILSLLCDLAISLNKIDLEIKLLLKAQVETRNLPLSVIENLKYTEE